ncbi:U3 small nucleolar RNA-associated protein [Diaporthe amygdali]|uniref:U3 small nucleolar RNA-associated protein n=1 Tax=Phomopsis amygdali TaxID=1214568 RepID=UPI0022FEA334|nr:U3 small nucleolar RNA-associated protein [Diaporthe amygdali]KAJ0117717.1 U3 small nucleolar RNA-associated protein [Diaporthe amygdali]
MTTRLPFKTTFEPERAIQPIFTGGSVALDNGARILATSLGEDAVLTDLSTGRQYARIEGDDEQISTLTLTPSASHLIVCSRSLSMRIYSLKVSEDQDEIEATLTRTLKPHGTPVIVLAVDRTGTLLATGAADGNIKVWDLIGGYVTHTFRGPSVLVSALHFFEIATSRLADEQLTGKKGKKTKRKSDVGSDDKNDATARFRLASGSQDGKVRVWDLHKRAVVADLESHVSDVQGLDYSASQHALVTASRDKTMIWWDAKSWTPRKVIPTFETMEAVGFLEDGRLTYTAGVNGCVRLWESDTGREVTAEQASKSEGDSIVGAVLCSEQNLLLTVQTDHTLVLYRTPSVRDALTIPELAPLEPLRRISGTHDEIIDLAYVLPDRSMMALGTNSEDVRLVSVAEVDGGADDTIGTGHYLGQDIGLLKGHDEIVITLDVDWSGHWIATGAKDNTARLWRVDRENNSYTCWAIFTGHAESLGAIGLPKTIPQDSSAAYQDPVNNPPAFLVTGSQDLTVKKWEIPRQAQKKAKALFTRKAHEKDINALDINPTGQLFASASQDKTVKIWSVAEGEVQGILRGHKRGVWSVRFAPANTPTIQGDKGAVAGKGLILTGSGDKTVKVWSLSDYTCLRTFEGHSNSILKVAWLNQHTEGDKSKRVQFASAGGDGLVKVWDVNSGETETTLDNHEDRVWALAVHPETNMIVSGSADSTITFWKDTSSQTQSAAVEAATKLIEQEQELENYMHTGAYRDAIALALQLNHPGRLLNLFTKVVTSKEQDKGSLSGLKAVDEVLATLSDEQIFLLLLRLRDWNTNARTAPVAQRILWAVVRSYPASKFSNLSVKGARGQKSLNEVLNALKVYTERHYKRMEELVDESYLVEYTLQEMENLAPTMDLPSADENGKADVLMLDASS